jgi:hypothetical protein
MKNRRTAPRKKPLATKTCLKWLYVFEVDDAVAPRRDPGKPNVRAEALAIKPGQDLESWVAKSPRARKLHITRVLDHEMPEENQPGGLLRPYESPSQQALINAALLRLREQLRCRRYTVNGSQDQWRLYVIELDTAKVSGMKPEHKGAVYVGETSLTREARAQQHREGKARSKTGKPLWSKDCHRSFKCPRPDLLPRQFQQEYFCQSAAKNHETKLRLHFEKQGYKVFGGKDRLDRFEKKAKSPA